MPPPSSATKQTFEIPEKRSSAKAEGLWAQGPLKACGHRPEGIWLRSVTKGKSPSGLSISRPVEESASALFLDDHRIAIVKDFGFNMDIF